MQVLQSARGPRRRFSRPPACRGPPPRSSSRPHSLKRMAPVDRTKKKVPIMSEMMVVKDRTMTTWVSVMRLHQGAASCARAGTQAGGLACRGRPSGGSDAARASLPARQPPAPRGVALSPQRPPPAWGWACWATGPPAPQTAACWLLRCRQRGCCRCSCCWRGQRGSRASCLRARGAEAQRGWVRRRARHQCCQRGLRNCCWL